jgi:hypothetical protein
MKYIFYYDQQIMTDQEARDLIAPIIFRGDYLAIIPRPGYPAEVITLPVKD